VEKYLRRENAAGGLEVFNVFNRANFASPVANLDKTLNFGRATQMLNRGIGGFNPVYQFGGPRTAQLGARLQFYPVGTFV
jgi:hypothetical protein